MGSRHRLEMNSIERAMNNWHDRFKVPKTASDRQFYKQFGDDFDRYSFERRKKFLEEVLAELREQHKNDEYIEKTYWDINEEKLEKWDILDYGSMLFRGRPTSRRIWKDTKKNPDYVDPKPIGEPERPESIKNDPPRNNDQGGFYFSRDVNL